jgi:hypothetical protein
VVGGGSEKSNKPSKLPEIYENGNNNKMDGFTHVLAYKLPKTLFFAQKYLTRYTQRRFLSNISILKAIS